MRGIQAVSENATGAILSLGSVITKRWLKDREPEWKRLEELLNFSEASVYQLTPPEVRELGFLYRSVINDLSRIRSQATQQTLEQYLNNLALRCHNRVYDTPPSRWQDFLMFYTHEFPQCFRRYKWHVLLVFLVFVLGTLLAFWTLHQHPETREYFMPPPVIEELKQGKLWMDDKNGAPSESSFLIQNNIRVAINAYTWGILLGVGTLVSIFYNGMFAFGGPMGVCYQYNMHHRLLNFVYAHGVIELTAIFIAGAAGMIIGLAVIFPGNLPRWTAVRSKAKDSLVLVMGCASMLVVAGVIEGMVSMEPSVPGLVRKGISLASALFLLYYFGWAGRRKTESLN